MLNVLQKWNKWNKSVVREDGMYTVISAFVRANVIKSITLKKEDSKQYTQASREEIEAINGERV